MTGSVRRVRRAATAVGLTAMALISGCAQGPAALNEDQKPTLAPPAEKAVVDRVVDGDTLIIKGRGKPLRVRLIGIDAPESVKPNSPVECFGPESGQFLKELLPAGSTIKLEGDLVSGDKDQYGRLLRTVFTKDGSNVAVAIATAGMGREYIYQSKPSRYADEIRAAQNQAQQSGAGLWSGCPTDEARS